MSSENAKSYSLSYFGVLSFTDSELQLRKEFPDRKLRGRTVKTYPETCFKWVYMMLERRNRMPQMKERLILFDFSLWNLQSEAELSETG